MNEEAKKLFAEKAQEFKHFLVDLIQALKEIADKYNGENTKDEVEVNKKDSNKSEKPASNTEDKSEKKTPKTNDESEE